MGLELAVREPPSPPPIRTSGNDAKLHEESPSKSGNDEDVDCCVTPKSERTAVKPVLLCPPSPRKKPRPAKRRCSSPQERYFPVPDDLTLVFIPVPCPSTKKARVAWSCSFFSAVPFNDQMLFSFGECRGTYIPLQKLLLIGKLVSLEVIFHANDSRVRIFREVNYTSFFLFIIMFSFFFIGINTRIKNI